MQKNRIKYYFLLLFFLTSAISHAQEVNYFTGPPIKNFDDENFKIIGSQGQNLYTFNGKDNNYYLTTYDTDSLKIISTVRIPLPPKDSVKYYLRDYFVRNDTIIIFYSFYQNWRFTEKLEMITFSSDGKKFGEAKFIDDSYGFDRKKYSRFYITENKDKSEILSYSYNVEKDSLKLRINRISYSGKILSTEEFKFEADKIYYGSLRNDVDGNVYLVSRDRRRKRNVQWQLQVYANNTDSVFKIDLKLPAEKNVFLINEFELYYDSDETVLLATPYSLEQQNFLAKGIYILRMNMKTHKLVSERVVPFKTAKDTLEKSEGFSLRSCFLTDCLPLTNKGKRFLFESRLEILQKVYGITVSKEYDMGNIFTVDMDSSFNVTEIHKIKKQQYSSVDAFKFIGFTSLCRDNETYFIYNELPENISKSPDDMKPLKTGKLDESGVIYTKLGQDKVSRKILIPKTGPKNVDLLLPWSSFVSRPENEMFVVRKIKDDFFLTKIVLTK